MNSAANQDTSIEAAKLGNATNETTFGLPIANRVSIHIGQPKRIGETIWILAHQVGDMSDVQPTQSGCGNRID
jgi:hypothetical protein